MQEHTDHRGAGAAVGKPSREDSGEPAHPGAADVQPPELWSLSQQRQPTSTAIEASCLCGPARKSQGTSSEVR